MKARPPSLDVFALQRPDPALWRYYMLRSLLAGPGFPILLLISWFRFRTLRYRLDEEGISMRWGVLFRREVNLTYARIQDIHLSSNAAERWLGLARIQIQTASGSARAEMTIEGVPAFEELRDFLYSRMRGVAEPDPEASRRQAPVAGLGRPSGARGGELAEVLRQTAAELRALREALATARVAAGSPGRATEEPEE